jgi:hypothetical protein
MNNVHFISATETSPKTALSIHDVDLTKLAGVADTLLDAGRADLAAQIVAALYYIAERQIDRNNVVSFRDPRRGYA